MLSLPEISIRRPVTVFMVMMVVLLLGIVSLTKLPVELYANTSFGEISIIINVRGGIPPTEVESQVTRIVEEAVATVSNLEQLLSISKEGESTVVLSFQQGTDMDFAALEVREKFSKVKNQLPKDIEKPVIAQFQQGDVPVVIVSASSQVRSTEAIRKIVDETMKDDIKRVSGVANVEIAGGRERKILIEADRTLLAAQGISIDEITGSVGANNLNLLSGEVERKEDRFLVRMIGEFSSIDTIRNLPLRLEQNGRIVRVKDVATVKDSFLEPREYARLNTRPVVTIYIQKESSRNTITVAKEILKQLDLMKEKLPKDIHLVVTSNQAEFIKKAVDNLTESLFKGVVLIILVFFLFLYRLSLKQFLVVVGLVILTLFVKELVLNCLLIGLIIALIVIPKYRPILVVTAPIPVSVIGSFIFMRWAGLTINVMTLFGLALGVGMLIDNSIVVFENILKKVEEGKDIYTASAEGSREMFLTLIASTATIVIVFLPLVFMGQELQKLYSGMSATIVISLVISVLCALTLIPMMCARKAFSVAESVADSARKGGASGLKKFANIERRFLFKSVRLRWQVLAASAGLFAISFFFVTKLGVEYLGGTEQNKFTAYIEMPTGVRLEASDKIVKSVEKILKTVPEVKNITSRVEGWSSKVYVEVKKSTERRRSLNEIIESIRPQTDRLVPAFIYFQQEEQVGTKELVLEIFGYSYEKLREIAIAVSNQLGQIKGLTDVKIRMREGRPEMDVLVNKKQAGFYELTAKETADQIHGQMRGFRAGEFHTSGKEVEIISRLDEKHRKTFKDLHQLIVSNKQSEGVLLDQVADFRFGLGPSEIWRKNKSRMVQVSANLGRVPLGKVADQVKKVLKSVPFPEDYFYRIAGDYPTMIRVNKQLVLMIAFVLILVYLVLASLFESFFEPFLIMTAVPLATVGAVAALYFSIYGLGIIAVLIMLALALFFFFRKYYQPAWITVAIIIMTILGFAGIKAALSLGARTIGTGAMFGIMMLGGIVVNHSIMLIDRINYYCKKGDSPVRAAILANRHRFRPILMTMSMTVLGMFPMAIDRSEGANLWSPLASTVIGGVITSTIFTLMVMPAFYIIYRNIGSFLGGLFRREQKTSLPAAKPDSGSA